MMRSFRRLWILGLTALLGFGWLGLIENVAAQVPPPAPPQRHPIVLRGGTVYTMTGTVIENGAIRSENGRITAVGPASEVDTQGAEVIDVSPDQWVFPALIDANTILGLVEIDAVRATRDFQETGEINPNVRAEVAINPDSEHIATTRANGVLLVLTAPRGGIIAGRSAVIQLDGWTWEQMTLRAPIGLHINWPRLTPIRAYWMPLSPEEQIKRAKEQMEKLERAFEEARAYWIAKKAEGRRGVPQHDVDLRWEAMMPVFEGRLPVFVHADTVDQIESAVAFADRYGFRMVLVGGADAWRVTDLLKDHDIPVILGPIQRLPQRDWEPYDTPFRAPLRLYQAGVRFCISGGAAAFGGSAWRVRNLPYQAAMAVAYGLPREEAWKAITRYCAEILGVADRVGTLEVGKDATLIVTTGDPLDIRTQVVRAFIQGRPVDLSNRHKRLYEKYREKYRQLRGTSR